MKNRNNMYVLFKACLFVILLPGILEAQRKVKFGQVPATDLEMTVYDADSSAVAVMLYQRGKFDKEDYKFTHHQRIKVLRQAGTSYGNIVLRVPDKSAIRAYVFNLENGEVVKEKLDNSSIYKERFFEGYHLYKIFLPNVKVGSVIDVEYRHVGIPFEWRFQQLIPVKHNELILEDSQYLIYKRSFKGFQPIKQIRENHWVAENVPAFVPEPHLNDYSNYISKFEFELEVFKVPGFSYTPFTTSWEKVSSRMLESSHFGEVFTTTAFLNEKARELRDSTLTIEEKVHAAYKYIQDRYTWDNYNSAFASLSYSEKLKKAHAGSSGDINLALISLLRKMDITTYPVIMSTRDNGLINTQSATISRINYVVAYVEEGDFTLLLDASLDSLVPGVLPAKCLNGPGWVILEREKGKWIDLGMAKPSIKRKMVDIQLDDNGDHEITVSGSRSNYFYLDWADELKKAGSDEAMARMVESSSSISVLNCEVTKNNKERLSASDKLTVEAYEHIDDLGDELIVSPYVTSELLENPFKSENRMYPVDMNYRQKFSMTVAVHLTENMHIPDPPQSYSLKTPDGNATFNLWSTYSGSDLQLRYQFELKKTIFTEAEYPILRNFYSAIISKLNESIQIKRT